MVTGSIWHQSFGDKKFRVLETERDGKKSYMGEIKGQRMSFPKMLNFGSNRTYAQQYMGEQLKNHMSWAKRIHDDRQERKRAVNPYKSGDILHSSWGYDQTNNDFYQVVASKGKTVHLRPIGAEYRSTGFMAGMTKPTPNRFLPKDNLTGEKILKRRVTNGNVRIDDTRRANKWDRDETYESSYA